MAMNIGQMRNALTGSSIPAGWNYDAMNSCYKGPNGEIITEMDILQHGSFIDALREYKIQQSYELAKQSMMTNTGPVGPVLTQGLNAANPWASQSLNVGHGIKPTAEISMSGKLGTVTINLDTGELKMPPNIGRDAAIRDFWLGFQEYYQPTNKAQYESKIKKLEAEIKEQHDKADEYAKYVLKEANKKVAAKISAKYSGEKFIMVKPDDLIKFIESD